MTPGVGDLPGRAASAGGAHPPHAAPRARLRSGSPPRADAHGERVVLLGGAFDPPHEGHVALARGALERFRPERLLVLVVAEPGHKGVEAPPEARLRLARAAFESLPGVAVELDRHARTVDLLRGGRWNDPVFVIGADEFCDFLSWKEPEEVLRLARLGVATRPGYPRDRLEAVLSRLGRPERVEFFEITPVDVSSTEVRRRIAAGGPVDGLAPTGVVELARALGVYQNERSPRQRPS